MSKSDRIRGIDRPGVLNGEQIKRLIDHGYIKGRVCPDKDIGDSSFDLHVGEIFWELPAGFKCTKDKSIVDLIETAAKSIQGISRKAFDGGGKILKKGKTHLFQIQEEISLPHEMFAQGTGKSTIGRLDVLTRLLVEREEKYDFVPESSEPKSLYKSLYVEVTPLSFDIEILPRDSIYQLRVIYGGFEQLQIDEDIVKLYSILMKDKYDERIKGPSQNCLRLNLQPTAIKGLDYEIIAFKAKKFEDEKLQKPKPLQLSASEKTYDPREYWDCITVTDEAVKKIGDDRYSLKVTRDDFYILRSGERFTLPDDIAVYGIAMTEEVGELRIHHAGFVHPLFGSKRPDHKGTPLIFEVRGHDIDMYLTDGDLMAKLRYYSMSQPIKPKKKLKKEKDSTGKDPYEEQELKLSKIFKDFENAA
jgi:dCTP deaminase